MVHKPTSLPPSLVPMHPGLGVLRLAALLAEGTHIDREALDDMTEQVEEGALEGVTPAVLWPELARGLMGRDPARLMAILRECGALKRILPEVDVLFGIPQIADPVEVDIGEHILAALNQAAQRDASIAVRFALLVMNVGKADSPREHLPVHYRHIERGTPRIEAIAKRFGVTPDCRQLALLALNECERIHRVSEVRAGPVALLLDRLGAFADPDRFAQVMVVCACDFFAYGGREEAEYPKEVLLATAIRACGGLDLNAFGEVTRVDLQSARAAAISRAFGSLRWSDETKP